MTEADVWARFAAAALTGLAVSLPIDESASRSAELADELLAEWKERFPQGGATTGAAQPQE